MKRGKVFILLVALAFPCDDRGEELGEPDFEVFDSYHVLEVLEELREHPLDLNTASVSQLTRIPWITPLLAQQIVAQRGKVGRFGSVDALRSLPEVSATFLDKVKPYLKVSRVELRERLPIRLLLRSRLSDRRPTSEGYDGDSRKSYNRLRIDWAEKVSLGLLSEKDSYEASYRDFLAGYLQIWELAFIHRIVLGHFQLAFGEGLLFSAPRFIMKTSGIIKGSESGLEPHTSTDENSSLFGAAFAAEWADIRLLPFYSTSKLDATLDESGKVKSLYRSGYHRTESELDKVDKLTERLFGCRLEWGQSDWLKIGVTGYRSRYEPELAPPEAGYYSFSGDTSSLVGADFDLLLGELELFGECARTLGLGQGGLLGSVVRFPGLELSTLVRHYDDDFYSPHSSAFADGDDENERGAFGAVAYRLSRRTKVRGYFDLFQNPKPGYQAPFPVGGRESVGEIEHKLLRDLDLHFRYRLKGKDKWTENESRSKLLLHRKEYFRFQADWKESKSISLRFRSEVTRAEIPALTQEDGGGLLLFGVVFKPARALRLEGRLIYFDTDSYEARIYEYENDLPGVMRNVALYGTGRRFYLLIQERFAKVGKFSLKYGITSKRGEITESEYGAQLDLTI